MPAKCEKTPYMIADALTVRLHWAAEVIKAATRWVSLPDGKSGHPDASHVSSVLMTILALIAHDVGKYERELNEFEDSQDDNKA